MLSPELQLCMLSPELPWSYVSPLELCISLGVMYLPWSYVCCPRNSSPASPARKVSIAACLSVLNLRYGPPCLY